MRTYIFLLSRNHLFLFSFSEFQISTDPVPFSWGAKELLSQWEWSILLVTSHSIISGIWSLDWDECIEQPPGSCKYSREKWFFFGKWGIMWWIWKQIRWFHCKQVQMFQCTMLDRGSFCGSTLITWYIGSRISICSQPLRPLVSYGADNDRIVHAQDINYAENLSRTDKAILGVGFVAAFK